MASGDGASTEPTVSDGEVLQLWRALDQGELADSWGQAFGAAFTREEFDEIGLPAGVTRDSAWEFYRRITGIAKVRMAPPGTEGSTYAITPEMVELLHAIDTRCTSSLDDSFKGMRDTRARFVTRALMEEAVESAMHSGSTMSRGDAATLLQECLEPRTDEERTVANRYAVFSNLDAYAGRRFTPELIREVYADLTQGLRGADEGGVLRTESKVPEDRFVRWNLGPPPPPDQIEPSLGRLCDLLEERPPYVGLGHPLITGLVAYFWLVAIRPFRLSDTGLSRAIAGLYLYQHGYRTLHLLPLSDLLLTSMDSFRGELAGPQSPFPDITRFLIYQFKRVRQGLDDLWERVDARAEDERLLETRLRHRSDLSRRQKTIVARALDEPGATFSVKSHQRDFSLSRSTAFRDLQALVEKGYLSQHRAGHAWQYVAAPDIRERVAER